MIPLHALLLYAGIYAFVIALPGPNVIAIAARALAGGFRAAVPAAFGTAAGDIVLMSFSVFGLGLVAQASGGLFFAVKIAGVLYLLWLGYKYWTAPVDRFDVPAGSTGNLAVGYRAPVPLHQPHRIVAQIDARDGRALHVSATGTGQGGVVRFTATATFIVVGVEHFAAYGDLGDFGEMLERFSSDHGQ